TRRAAHPAADAAAASDAAAAAPSAVATTRQSAKLGRQGSEISIQRQGLCGRHSNQKLSRLEGPKLAFYFGAWHKLPNLVFGIVTDGSFELESAVTQVQSLGGPKHLGT